MRIAVYCGSREGNKAIFKEYANSLGHVFARHKISLVYGGSSTGLMGAIADGVLEEGGEVIGVIPKPLIKKEIAHNKITELRTVNTMHERKAQMYDLADGFIAMPGGIGTLEEFFEIYTWYGIGDEKKPFGVLNVDNYYSPLIHLLDHMVNEGFLDKELRNALVVEENPEKLVTKLKEKILEK